MKKYIKIIIPMAILISLVLFVLVFFFVVLPGMQNTTEAPSSNQSVEDSIDSLIAKAELESGFSEELAGVETIEIGTDTLESVKSVVETGTDALESVESVVETGINTLESVESVVEAGKSATRRNPVSLDLSQASGTPISTNSLDINYGSPENSLGSNLTNTDNNNSSVSVLDSLVSSPNSNINFGEQDIQLGTENVVVESNTAANPVNAPILESTNITVENPGNLSKEAITAVETPETFDVLNTLEFTPLVLLLITCICKLSLNRRYLYAYA